MRYALIFVFVSGGMAQINLTVTMVSDEIATAMLGKKISKTVQLYLVTIENTTAEQVLLPESAVVKRLQTTIMPVDSKVVRMMASQVDQTSWQKRVGRVISDLARLASFLAAGGMIAIGATGLQVATGVVALSPYIVQRVQGESPNILGNYEQIAWSGPVVLNPGDAVVKYCFGNHVGVPVITGSGAGVRFAKGETYFVQRGGFQFGPYTLAALQKMLVSGSVRASDLAKSSSMTEWVVLSQLIGAVSYRYEIDVSKTPRMKVAQ